MNKDYKTGDSLKLFPNGPKLKKNGKPYRWGTVIPLIGGMSLGTSMTTQSKPEFLLSFKGFQANEKHIREYWDDVPYFIIDDDDESKRPNIKKNKRFKNIDFINAVPPCAGLSQLNPSNNKDSEFHRGSEAKQNEWMYKTSEFALEHLKPKVFWGENAPGLFTKLGEGVVEKLREIAEKYDYSFSLIKTNTMLHGLPQKRERTFYFFWKSEHAPIMNYHYKDQPDYVEFLKGVNPSATLHTPDKQRKVSDVSMIYKFLLQELKLSHHEFNKKFKRGTSTLILLQNKLIDPCLKWLEENHPEHSDIRFLNHVKKKMDMKMGWWDKTPHIFYERVNALVGRNLSQSMHPTEERFLSTREMMHLMGLPDDFDLAKDSKGNIYINHIAQNVPTHTASDMAEEVCKFIDGELFFHKTNFLKQNNKHAKKETLVATKLF